MRKGLTQENPDSQDPLDSGLSGILLGESLPVEDPDCLGSSWASPFRMHWCREDLGSSWASPFRMHWCLEDPDCLGSSWASHFRMHWCLEDPDCLGSCCDSTWEKSGDYSSAATIRVRRLIEGIQYTDILRAANTGMH